MNPILAELNKDYSKRIIKRVLMIAACIVLFPIVSNVLSFNSLIQSTGIFILCIIVLDNVTRIISRTFIYIYQKSNNKDIDFEDLFILGIRNVSDFIKYILIFLMGLYLYGIGVSTFFTTVSIAFVAIVIAFKEFILNILAGMYLLFSKNLEVKQYVEIDGVRGKIIDVSYQTIEMKTDSGDTIFLPNSTGFTQKVINCAKDNLKAITIEISLLRDEMPLIKKIDKQLRKKLSQDYPEMLNKDNPITLKYKDILSKKVTFEFVIKTSKYSFEIEDKIQQVAFSIIGDLLIKYHSNDKNKKINSEE